MQENMKEYLTEKEAREKRLEVPGIYGAVSGDFY